MAQEFQNRMTNVMDRLSNMVQAVDGVFQEMGTEPYGQVKATAKEKREAFAALTPERLQELVAQHGQPEVNDWLRKNMEGD